MFVHFGTSSSRNHHVFGQLQDPRNRKSLLLGMGFGLLVQLFIGSVGFAGGLDTVAQQVCTWAPTVANIGTALAFIVFIAGIAMIAVGSRDGFGRTIWAILGSVALFGAVGLFNALTGGACGQGAAG